MSLMLRKLAAAAAATAAAVAARRAAEYGWTSMRGEDPPTARDVHGDSELRDLLLWSGLVAAAVLIARAVAKSSAESLLGVRDD